MPFFFAVSYRRSFFPNPFPIELWLEKKENCEKVL